MAATGIVNALPAIGTQPTPQTVCANANATFTVAATGSGLTYQWQEKVGAAAFANITNGGVYGGATSATLTLTNPAAAMSTNQYQCIISGTCAPAVTSTAVALTVTPVNATPTLDAIASIAIPVSAPLQTVNLAGIGIGLGDVGQILTVTATSSNLALIPNPTVTYTSPSATGSIQFTPVAAQAGTATITVTVTDNGGVACGAVNNVVRTFVVNVGVSAPPPPPAPAAQTITFGAIADVVFGSPAFNLVATASSGLPVSFVIISGANNISLSGNSVTTLNVGEVVIEARQAGNGSTVAAAAPVSRTFRVLPAAQVITGFDSIPDRAWNSGNFFLNATSTSGTQPTYTITAGQNIATIAAGSRLVTINPAVGRVTITATVPAVGNYNASATLTRSFNVIKANQTIGNIIAPFNGVFGQLTSATVSATASSNLPITTTVAGNATIAGNTLTINGAGTITLTFAQAGNDLWNAATTTTRSFVVAKANQTISFTQPRNTNMGVPVNLAATSSSGLPVLVSVITGTATVNGSNVTPTSGGEMVLELTQAGNDNFNPAPAIRTNFVAIPNITVSNLSVTRICGGNNLTVNYTTDGNFPSGNVFAAYISDANGSFNSAVFLGSTVGTGSGSLIGTIPNYLASGTGYRIQIYSIIYNTTSNNSAAFAVDKLPEQPFINYAANGDLQVVTPAAGLTLQWLSIAANGTSTPVSGATSATFKPTANGVYQLSVSTNGCAVLSNSLSFNVPVITAADEPVLDQLTEIYPNPSESSILLKTSLKKSGAVDIIISDVLGKTVYNHNETTDAGKYEHKIGLENLASGVYVVTLRVEGKTISRKIVKQ